MQSEKRWASGKTVSTGPLLRYGFKATETLIRRWCFQQESLCIFTEGRRSAADHLGHDLLKQTCKRCKVNMWTSSARQWKVAFVMCGSCLCNKHALFVCAHWIVQCKQKSSLSGYHCSAMPGCKHFTGVFFFCLCITEMMERVRATVIIICSSLQTHLKHTKAEFPCTTTPF